MNIVRHDRRHLATLYIAHSAIGKEDKDIRTRTAGKGIDRRAASIPRCGANDGCAFAALLKHMVHEAGQEPHRDILKGQRWSVEQFQ